MMGSGSGSKFWGSTVWSGELLAAVKMISQKRGCEIALVGNGGEEGGRDGGRPEDDQEDLDVTDI